jgi:hypothetical protein
VPIVSSAIVSSVIVSSVIVSSVIVSSAIVSSAIVSSVEVLMRIAERSGEDHLSRAELFKSWRVVGLTTHIDYSH